MLPPPSSLSLLPSLPPPLPSFSPPPSPFRLSFLSLSPSSLPPTLSPSPPFHIYVYSYDPPSLCHNPYTCSLPLTYFRVSDSQLGQPEAMRLFCKDLLKNKSVVELRYLTCPMELPNTSITSFPCSLGGGWSLGTRLLSSYDPTFVRDCVCTRYTIAFIPILT